MKILTRLNSIIIQSFPLSLKINFFLIQMSKFLNEGKKHLTTSEIHSFPNKILRFNFFFISFRSSEEMNSEELYLNL